MQSFWRKPDPMETLDAAEWSTTVGNRRV